jgi:hypothetical protein
VIRGQFHWAKNFQISMIGFRPKLHEFAMKKTDKSTINHHLRTFCRLALALGLLGLSPILEAVEPAAPDTALAGGNTADGQNALAA